MIKEIYYSNDKSHIKILPKNFEKWFSRFKYDLRSNEPSYGQLLMFLYEYMNPFTKGQRNITPKYAMEFLFKYFTIVQLRKKPFSIIIKFNYIQYLNESGFNFIKINSEFEELKDFVSNIIREYQSHLQEFMRELRLNWENLKNSKGRFLKDIYDKRILDDFERDIIKQFEGNPPVYLEKLSITSDIHFFSPVAKNKLLSTVRKLKKLGYDRFEANNQTVFLRPYNQTTQKIAKYMPVYRFYDKQADTKSKYLKKRIDMKKKGIKIKRDSSPFELDIDKFEQLDLVSQDESTLEKDFLEAYTFTTNVVRYEIEFVKEAIKREFRNNHFFSLNIDNLSVLDKHLGLILDKETSAYPILMWDPEKLGEYKRGKVKDVRVDCMTVSGDILEKWNYVIKHADFLNAIGNFAFIKIENAHKDLVTGLTREAIYQRLKKMRIDGIGRGSIKQFVLNQPYQSLLEIYNDYDAYSLLSKEITNRFKAKAAEGRGEASPEAAS